MKKISILFIAIWLGLMSGTAFSQGGGIWNFNWNTGFPLGSTTDFVGQPTARGFSVEGRGFVTDQITLGGIAGWIVFYEEVGWVTENQGTTTINGFKRRYLNAMPIMMTGHYYFTTGQIQPYIGAGLGTYYIETRDFMGIYYVRGKDWHFGLAPEVGVVFPFGNSNTGVNINFKYNWAAKTKSNPSDSWLGINVGLSYLF